AIVTSLAVLTAMGAFALNRRWPRQALFAMGIGHWLIVMAVIMPLTGGGWFATELSDGASSAIVGYLAVALVYSCCLEIARLAIRMPGSSPPATAPVETRRTVLIGLGSAFAALLGVYLVQRVTA